MDLRNPDTFAAVHREHAAGVRSAAQRILGDPSAAHDVAQDVFSRLWRRPDSYDPARGAIGPYLRLMARSRALDLWREAQSRGRAHDRFEAAVVAAEPLRQAADRPEDEIVRAEQAQVLRQGVRSLPAAQREAIALAFWGGLTTSEIAERVQVPLGTAKSRVRLGIAKLREICGDELDRGVAAGAV